MIYSVKHFLHHLWYKTNSMENYFEKKVSSMLDNWPFLFKIIQ